MEEFKELVKKFWFSGLVVFLMFLIFLIGVFVLFQNKKVDHGSQAAVVKQEDQKILQANNDSKNKILKVKAIGLISESADSPIAATGIIEAKNKVFVGAKVPDLIIKEVFVDIGDIVKKDDVLLSYYDGYLKNDFDQAKAFFDNAKLLKDQATADAEKARKFLRSSSAARNSSVNQLNAEKLYLKEKEETAQLNIAKAKLQAIQLRLNNAVVKSPVDGVIVDRNAEIGLADDVHKPLFQIIPNGDLIWRSSVSVENVGAIKIGDSVIISFNDEKIPAKIERIAPFVDKNTGQVTVWSSFQNKSLKIGMMVSGEFIPSNRIIHVLPENTILREKDKSYVWKINQDQTVSKKLIQTKMVNKKIAVIGGITTKDLLVLDGGLPLKEGDSVKVSE